MIYTKEELQRAISARQSVIEIDGPLAKEIRSKAKAKSAGRAVATLAILFGILSLPFTGGASSVAIAGGVGAATAAGLTISTAELAIIIGGGLAYKALCEGYDVDFRPNGHVVMRKKSRQN